MKPYILNNDANAYEPQSTYNDGAKGWDNRIDPIANWRGFIGANNGILNADYSGYFMTTIRGVTPGAFTGAIGQTPLISLDLDSAGAGGSNKYLQSRILVSAHVAPRSALAVVQSVSLDLYALNKGANTTSNLAGYTAAYSTLVPDGAGIVSINGVAINTGTLIQAATYCGSLGGIHRGSENFSTAFPGTWGAASLVLNQAESFNRYYLGFSDASAFVCDINLLWYGSYNQ